MGRKSIFIEHVESTAKRFFERFSDDLPVILPALLQAEDHRGYLHRGIDYLSIARALWKWPAIGKLYGISTIEQQLARTVFPRQGNLLLNKAHEMLLSIQVARELPKTYIWASYLEQAHYGTGLRSYAAVRNIFVGDSKPLSLAEAASIVACLKYPRPSVPTMVWERKHQRRREYVLSRLSTAMGDNAIYQSERAPATAR